jgi:hypothetical protein
MSVVLDFDSVDAFVTEQKARGNDVRWDGWTLVFFRKNRDERGFTSKYGAYRHKNWGFETRVEVNSFGKWKVPARSVKNP